MKGGPNITYIIQWRELERKRKKKVKREIEGPL